MKKENEQNLKLFIALKAPANCLNVSNIIQINVK